MTEMPDTQDQKLSEEMRMEPSRRAAYDAVNELLREDPAARPWRMVAVALAAALPIERQSGREDAARAIEEAAKLLVPKFAPADDVMRRAVLTAHRAAEIARGHQREGEGG